MKYSASAGTGKTHALTAFYLSKVLLDPGAYRVILAVTFTNAAASEMKERILRRLHLLGLDTAGGRKERGSFAKYLNEYFPVLWPDPQQAELIMMRNAPKALENILQDYSRFAVGTIDSFFQRVIRAFAREIDIPAGYEIELEHESILSDAVDALLSELATDKKLLEWISSYVASRLDDSKGWDIRREIMEIAGQLFREEFRQLSDEQRAVMEEYRVMADYAGKVFAIRQGFESELVRLARRGIEIYTACGLTPDDFLSKRRGGVGAVLEKYARKEVTRPGGPWNKALGEGRYHPATAPPTVAAAFVTAMSQGLGEVVNGISQLFDERYPLYLSAMAQLRTIHVMGILGAISRRVRDEAHQRNLFLLSDSGELIGRLIADDDTPFIYEKIGAAYDHYIIDEFQDTSRIQWNNFRPLMAETLSRGMDNLVVGDVKQSIYRWRNSDWRIIHSEAEEAFGSSKVEQVRLNINYRSRLNIIRFNNMLFGNEPEAIPAGADAKAGYEGLSIREIYRGAEQEGREERPDGWVRVRLYADREEMRWKERVLNDLPQLIEELQDKGCRADEILFLCRTNEEGKAIISRILEYSASVPPEKKERYNYEITSGESLMLERNPSVTLLVACLKYLVQPESRINRSQMVRSYVLATGGERERLYLGDCDSGSDDPLPDGWEKELEGMRNLSLSNAVGDMIRLFRLGENSANMAYLASFRDLILAWTSRNSSDTSAFIEWWDNEGHRSTISQSDRQEAMKIMTIHKAKGLQSKVIVVPFAGWEAGQKGFGRPLLWVTNVPDPFAPMPVVLPERIASLDDSLFADEAKREKASEWLDAVNLLYVAFTRAADVLLVMAPDTSSLSTRGGGTAQLINEALKTLPDNFTLQEDNEQGIRSIECGTMPDMVRETREPQRGISSFRQEQRRSSPSLRTGGTIPADTGKLPERGGRAYGIMMHEILSNIVTVEDIEAAVDNACRNGLLSADGRDDTISRIRRMITAERVRGWFDGSCRVMTEATIILPSGAVRRPDRVMSGDGETIAVDYKFGEEVPHHRRQAAQYRELLEAMGCHNVRSYLWYVEREIIEEV